jgi:hypothetical protein
MAKQLPAPALIDARYGVIEPTDGRGIRIVVWGASEACAVALCKVAREHGHRPTDTSHFLTESKSH